MKRLLSAIFITLLLCQNISTSQAQTNASREPNPPSPVVIEEQNTADEKPEPRQEQAKIENEATVGEQNAPLINRIKKLADATNLALFFSFLATVIAFLSWLAARKSVDVTREIGQKQTRAYLSIASVEFVMDREDNMPRLNFTARNTGNSPANDIFLEDLSFMINVSWMENMTVVKGDIFTQSSAKTFKSFVNDLMAGEEESSMALITGASPQFTMNIINDFLMIYDNENIVSLSVECSGIVAYEDVFGNSHKLPFNFFGFDFDRAAKRIPLKPYRKLTVEKVREFWVTYADNKIRQARFE